MVAVNITVWKKKTLVLAWVYHGRQLYSSLHVPAPDLEAGLLRPKASTLTTVKNQLEYDNIKKREPEHISKNTIKRKNSIDNHKNKL